MVGVGSVREEGRCARFDIDRATMAALIHAVFQFSLISRCLFVGQQFVITAWVKCGSIAVYYINKINFLTAYIRIWPTVFTQQNIQAGF